MLNNIKIILSYELKIKIREIKSMVKNLFSGLLAIAFVLVLMVFQFTKFFLANQEQIQVYQLEIFAILSFTSILFCLFYKKAPFFWHPATMLYFSGSNFRPIISLNFLKKSIVRLFWSLGLALILNNFAWSLKTAGVFLGFWNLFMLSLITRYYIYHKALSCKILACFLTLVLFLNLQFYANKYLSLILLLSLSSLTLLIIREVLDMDLNFNKAFTDMIFVNRANYLARGNQIEDAQEFLREISAEKHRRSLVNKINFKNPLIQKNILSFSRLNLSVTFFLFFLLILITLLYRFEIFDTVRIIKDLGLGLPILVLNQTIFVSNIINLISDQRKLLLIKSKNGLFLPYKKYKINNSFMALGIPILLFASLIIGLILKRSLFIIIAVFSLYSIILYISLILQNKLRSNFFLALISLAIMGA